jgi:hypothetical protein
MGEAGRPTKYRSEYADQVVDHCRNGASLTSFAAEIGVARATINNWIGEHQEFADACNRAKTACAAWWERIARANAENGEGSATLCIFGLKNMGSDDWSDVHDVRHSGYVAPNREAAEAEVIEIFGDPRPTPYLIEHQRG